MVVVGTLPLAVWLVCLSTADPVSALDEGEGESDQEQLSLRLSLCDAKNKRTAQPEPGWELRTGGGPTNGSRREWWEWWVRWE